MIEQINSSHYLRQLEDIRDGDIICFQRWEEREGRGGERGRERGREAESRGRLPVLAHNRHCNSHARFTLLLPPGQTSS